LATPSKYWRRGIEVEERGPDDSQCSRNALGLVCLVNWSVWFLWMSFQSDQPNKPNRPDRPDEPAFVGGAQWKINQPPYPLEEKMSELGWITSRYGIVQVRVVEGSLAVLLLAERRTIRKDWKGAHVGPVLPERAP
jgi:hypothetical protein